MLHFLCTASSCLAKSLRDRYDIRSRMIIRDFPDSDLLVAEYEIVRISRLLARHRRRCAQCQLDEGSVVRNRKDFEQLSRKMPLPSLNMAR